MAGLPKDPSEEALRTYFEGVDTKEPYEAVRDKIVDAIRERRAARAKAEYMQSLRSAAHLVLRLPPPRAQLSMSGVPTRGTVQAPITMLEFADYECPYCQQIQPIVERLEAEYKGKLLFAFKDYPLQMHASAEKAAEAVHCAEAQEKFWEYHDLLLASKHPEVPALKSYARDLKLDTAAFDRCLDSGAKAEVVKANLSEAQALGLQGTPTFFVNGRYVSGTLSYENLRSVIAEELSAAEATVPSAAINADPSRQPAK
jgi:protein-disulfide isomerase